MRCITGIGKDKGYFIGNSRLRRNPKNHNFRMWPSEKEAGLFTGPSAF